MKFILFITAWSLFKADFCLAGVGHGNPSAAFYNMSQDYVANLPYTGLMLNHEPINQGQRVDVDITYRENGYFFIGISRPEFSAPYLLCDQYQIASSKAQLFWIGKNCQDAFFRNKWTDLQLGVVGLKFPHQ